MWFEAILGLNIDLEKSEMILIREVRNVKDLACEVGCNVGKLPTSYLGLPLGASYKSVSVWDKVEERFYKRLSIWKLQYLFKRERLMLLKSVLASLPIYLMSMFKIPEL